MNRPRLSFVQEYFQDIANKGNEEAQDLMSEYFDIKENQGEFLAGRFIIEVYIEMQKTLEENYNNERST
jgi:hydrogenase maturation factor